MFRWKKPTFEPIKGKSRIFARVKIRKSKELR